MLACVDTRPPQSCWRTHGVADVVQAKLLVEGASGLAAGLASVSVRKDSRAAAVERADVTQEPQGATGLFCVLLSDTHVLQGAWASPAMHAGGRWKVALTPVFRLPAAPPQPAASASGPADSRAATIAPSGAASAQQRVTIMPGGGGGASGSQHHAAHLEAFGQHQMHMLEMGNSGFPRVLPAHPQISRFLHTWMSFCAMS